MRTIKLWRWRMRRLWERIKAEGKRFAYEIGWETDEFDGIDY